MCQFLQLANDPDVQKVELDEPVCSDLVSDEPEPTSGRRRRSFDPTELTWNIDRLDERTLPLDGGFCPAADGEYSFNTFKASAY